MSADTKEKIAATAQKLFGEKGFHGTSVREISREAGVSLSMINYHYGSKEGLFNNLVQTLFIRMHEGVKNIQSSSISAKEKINAFIDLFTDQIRENEDLMRFLATELIMENNTELTSWIAEKMEIINQAIEDIITEGIENENFQLKVDLTFLVSVPFSLFTFWLKNGAMKEMQNHFSFRLPLEAYKENVKQTIFALI